MTTLTPSDLVAKIVGPGISFSNVQFKGKTGVNSSAGIFTGGTGILDNGPGGKNQMECGIILSTGAAKIVIGPNNLTGAGQTNNLPGDPQLQALLPPNTPTFDATVLEFDFIPATSQLTFKYVFGSEEYNEFANSGFNDVFGFFLNGTNVALLPGTNTPVSINNVNGGNPLGTNPQNPQFFVNNDFQNGTAPFNTQLDGLTVVLTVNATVIPGVSNHIKLGIADAGDSILDSDVFIKAGSFSSGVQTNFPLFATGADIGGGPQVNVYDQKTGELKRSFFAYDQSFRGGVRVAVADINGDGNDDIITVPGPGGGPHVKVFDGLTGKLIQSFFAYDPGFGGGLYVAAAKLGPQDKTAAIFTAPDAGGGPDVKIFDSTANLINEFWAYDPSFYGGVRIAVGNINGDQVTKLVTAPGVGGGPHVKVFAVDGTLQASFFAYDPAFQGGVYVATGAVTTINQAVIDPSCAPPPPIQQIIVGPGAGGGPQIKILDGRDGTLIKTFFVEDTALLFFGDAAASFAGVRVATADINQDGTTDILVSFGPGHPPVVRIFDFATTNEFKDITAYDPNYFGGVFVAGR